MTAHDREMLDVPTEAPTPPHSAGAEYELQGAPEPEARSQWQLFFRRFLRHRMAVFSLLILVGLIVLCFGADFLAPYEKNQQDLLLGPVPPSAEHWFGTDELGRDQVTEIMYAGQISLKIGLIVALIATVIGTAMGASAGFYGGGTDQFLMRLTDLFLVVPAIALLAIAIQMLRKGVPISFAAIGAVVVGVILLVVIITAAVRLPRGKAMIQSDNAPRKTVIVAVVLLAAIVMIFIGPTLTLRLPIEPAIMFVLAGLGWMYIARVVRGQVLSIKEKEYVEAARASGASNLRIIVRHVIPNTVGPILVNATLGIAAAITIESALSFLGFGVQPPTNSWGRMLADARGNVGTSKAHLIYFPGLALLLTVLSVNFIGDGLRDAFDPESRR
jgi:peptide/nickel transport system permease protein